MIFKIEDIYSLHLGKLMFSFKNNSIPSSFSRSMLRTNQVDGYNTRLEFKKILYSFLSYKHKKVYCFLSRSCLL